MHYKKSGFMVEDYDFIVIVTRFRNLIVILLLWKIFHRHVRVARASPLVKKKNTNYIVISSYLAGLLKLASKPGHRRPAITVHSHRTSIIQGN